jgi:hemin uptake protein HemP
MVAADLTLRKSAAHHHRQADVSHPTGLQAMSSHPPSGDPVHPTNPDGEHAGSVPQQPPRQVDSADLLQGSRELLIQHEGETYRLRLTKTGKLILNK